MLMIGSCMSQLSGLLRSTLERLGLTQKRLADVSGLSPKHVNALAQGNVGMTGVTAVVLERATGVPAQEWLQAHAADLEQRARDTLPTAQQEAERYVRRRFEATGFAPEESNLTPRDKEVIRLLIEHLGVR